MLWLLLLGPQITLAQTRPGAASLVKLPEPVAAATPPTIPGQLLLRLKPAFQPAAFSAAAPTVPALTAALQTLGATDLRQKFPHSRAPDPRRPGGVDLRLLYQITVPPGLPPAKARTVLLSTGAVEYVEPLYIRAAQFQPNDPGADTLAAGRSAANSQLYLQLIRAYRAWDVFRGDSTLVIGIVDGNVRLGHEDLRQQVKYNYADPIDGLDNDQDGYVDNFRGWDLANNDNDPGFDPQASVPTHGSEVAGVAAAQADNGRGLAGVGLRCRFLPLNIFPNTDSPTGSFAGYEAIVYAADHGCQVINLSWGAPGGYSRFEQEAITYAAVNRDVVVVAAAGNTNADLRFYPASYEHVLSVTGVANNDVRSRFATYNSRVDLTAPAEDLLTTLGADRLLGHGPVDADYHYGSGTSLAAPQVAAAAALVRGRFPGYSAAQVIAQLRQTADNIDALPANAAFAGRLGTGRLNMARALTETNRREARVVQSRFAPARPSYAPGEALQLTAKVLNLLSPLRAVQVTLTSLSPYLRVEQGEFAAGSLATLDSARNRAAPFQLRVASQNVPLNTIATLRYRLTAADGYQTDDFVDVQLNPDYVTLDAGDLALSLTSRGNLGYDGAQAIFGQGVTYKNGPPLLSEGGLLLATSPSRVSDRLRGAPRGTGRESFFSLSQARRVLGGPRADQQAQVLLQDSLPALDPQLSRSLGVRVRLRGLSWATAPRRDVVLLEYWLRNVGPAPLEPLLAGLLLDWDLPGEPGRNAAVWDSVRQLGYCYDVGDARQYAGVRLLRGGAPATYAIDNNAPTGTPVCFADGFTRAEKYLTLSSGTAHGTRSAGLPTGADVTQVVGANLGRVAPGDSVQLVLAVLAAGSLPELEAAADAAQTASAQLLPARPATATASWHVFPNPTTGPLHLEVPAALGAREAQVTDALGRLVRRRPVSGPALGLDLAGLPPGAYTVRVLGAASAALARLVVLQ